MENEENQIIKESELINVNNENKVENQDVKLNENINLTNKNEEKIVINQKKEEETQKFVKATQFNKLGDINFEQYENLINKEPKFTLFENTLEQNYLQELKDTSVLLSNLQETPCLRQPNLSFDRYGISLSNDINNSPILTISNLNVRFIIFNLNF